MNGKLIGAVLILVGCSSFGFAITVRIKQEELSLRQLIAVLDYIQCELQFRMTPLPDLCRQAAQAHHNKIGKFFWYLSAELENQLSSDVQICVHKALSCVPDLPKRSVDSLEILGRSLGRFDLDGQIQGLEAIRGYCRSELEKITDHADERRRSYQTLGICTGAALAILFV